MENISLGPDHRNLTLWLKSTESTADHSDTGTQCEQTVSAQHIQHEKPQPTNNLLDLLRSVIVIINPALVCWG